MPWAGVTGNIQLIFLGAVYRKTFSSLVRNLTQSPLAHAVELVKTVLRLAPCSSSLPVPQFQLWPGTHGVVENTESHRGLVDAASFLDGRSNLENSWKRWPLNLRAGMVKNIQGEGNYLCEGIWVRASRGRC